MSMLFHRYSRYYASILLLVIVVIFCCYTVTISELQRFVRARPEVVRIQETTIRSSGIHDVRDPVIPTISVTNVSSLELARTTTLQSMNNIVNNTANWTSTLSNSSVVSNQLCPVVYHSARNLTPPWGNDTILDVDLSLPIPDAYSPHFKNPCWFVSDGGKQKLQCLPYFFLAGFPKSGTTDLFYKMSKHPEIKISVPKEPVWWPRQRYGLRGKRFKSYMSMLSYGTSHLERLYSANQSCPVTAIIGDGSACTIWDNSLWRKLPGNKNQTEPRILTAHHIRYHLPDAKIIVILRNPVTRLYSGYNYFRRGRNKTMSLRRIPEEFHKRVISEIDDTNNCLKTASIRTCAYDRAKLNRVGVRLYTIYLEDWLKIFPKEQIHILRTEDYQTNERTELTKIVRFLGLNDISNESYRRMTRTNNKNSRTVPREMLDKTRDILQQFYEPFNRRLADLLGDDKFMWKT